MGSAKGSDYNNWIGANHGSATQVARGWGGGSNSIGLNTGSASQFSDYKDQASDYSNWIGVNTGSAIQHSDYKDQASDYRNHVDLNQGGLTQMASGWGGGFNTIGVNGPGGHALQVSDYNSDYNFVGTNQNGNVYQYDNRGATGPLVNGKALASNVGGVGKGGHSIGPINLRR